MDDLFDVVHETRTPIVITNDQSEIEGIIVRSNVIGAMTTDNEYDAIDSNEKVTDTKEEEDHE